jgi:hypothetical protein
MEVVDINLKVRLLLEVRVLDLVRIRHHQAEV